MQLYDLGVGLIWIHVYTLANKNGIMLEDAPESTKKLCTFILKISKDNKNGGVIDFDHLPIIESFKVAVIFLKATIILDDLPLL